MPGSEAPHIASRDAVFSLLPLPESHRVLSSGEIERPRSSSAAALLDELRGAGAWTRVVSALAESVATCELIESETVRFRLRGCAGYATWEGGGARGCILLRPYPHKMSIEALRISLGLYVPEYGTCERCGALHLRVLKSGALAAHKRAHGARGVKCRRPQPLPKFVKWVALARAGWITPV